MIRVLIVDDHPVVREGLKRIVDGAPGLETGAEAGTPAQALQHLQAGQWDVVLLDLDLPDRGGLELLRDITRTHPSLPVLVLSFHAEAAYGVPSLQAGADGYLMKDISPTLLVEAIQKVAGGGKFVTAALAEQLACAVGDAVTPLRHGVLSARERQVMCLLGAGLAVSEVATQMALSVKTISTYRRRVLDKMGLGNNAQLMQYAIRHQLIE
jgi:DNA-binding NarL/FixJ family response regulator